MSLLCALALGAWLGARVSKSDDEGPVEYLRRQVQRRETYIDDLERMLSASRTPLGSNDVLLTCAFSK